MRKEILDIPIDWITHDELVRKLKVFVVNREPHQIATVNAEFLALSQRNAEFKQVLQASDLNVADGSGVVIAQLFNDQNKSANIVIRALSYIACGLQFLLRNESLAYRRITGIELSETIMQIANQEGWNIYLLGAQPGIAEKAAKIWHNRYPNVAFVGISANNPGDTDTVPSIIATKPDVLLVAYGAPKQDLFIAQHKQELKVPIMIGVGGTFDTLVGTKYNPPRWIKRLGLEGISYLFRYPKRFARIWRSLITFSKLVISHKNN